MKKAKNKDRNTIIKDANKRLAQNPKDPAALLSLAELFFNEQTFDKSFKTYEILIDLCATQKDLDEYNITLKYALSAMQLKKYSEAYKSFLIARSMKQDVFEINYNLGVIEYQNKKYEKAAKFLAEARKEKPENEQTLKYLGSSLFKMKRYKEAAIVIRKTIDLNPDDKELLFILAQTYHNLGHNDQAIKIFTHLRADPNFGPNSALYAGTIHLNTRQYDKAVMDFEIGLRHDNIKTATLLELRYRLASVYLKQQEINSALKYLEEIYKTNPEYKDVSTQIHNYMELNANQNLQIFLMSGSSEFVTLCRKLSVQFFPKAIVKITDITIHQNEYADILTEINTKEWDDIVLFRYIRTTGQVGELTMRELYSRIKEIKAGRGLCLTAGTFSEEAKKFVEARLIDLIEKDELLQKLKSVN